ncbi:hypothetical protein N2152v2_003691 [Parachlorella kessleri]
MQDIFQDLAERRGFIIVAPDSSNPEGWGGDLAHIQACEEEVRSMPGVCFPPLGAAYLIAGFSGGAMYCPLLGFRYPRFSAQALLHGHLQPACFLSPAANAPHLWLSTGSRDALVPPHVLQEAAERVKAGSRELSSSSLTVRLDYDAAHEVTVQEAEELVDWHAFSNRWLLRLALVHSSAAPETDNASLAWLGDAALGLMTTEHIMAALGAGTPVGQLTKARERLVSRQECVRQARSIGLDQVLVIGQGMAGQMSQNMLAEAYEAVVGAVYTDGGFEAVRKVYLKHFPPIQQLLAAAQPGGVEGN